MSSTTMYNLRVCVSVSVCVCKTYCTTVSCSFLSSKTHYDYEEPHKIGLNGSTRPVTARVLVGEREREGRRRREEGQVCEASKTNQSIYSMCE